MKNFHSSKVTNKRMKGQPTEGRRYLSNLFPIKDLYKDYVNEAYKLIRDNLIQKEQRALRNL